MCSSTRVFFRIFVSSMALSRIFLLSQEQACSSERQKSIREFPLCLNPWLLHKNQPSMNYFQSPPAQSSTSIFSILNIILSLLVISSSLIMSNPWHLRKHTEFAASVPDKSICCSVNSVSRCARFVYIPKGVSPSHDCQMVFAYTRKTCLKKQVFLPQG